MVRTVCCDKGVGIREVLVMEELDLGGSAEIEFWGVPEGSDLRAIDLEKASDCMVEWLP